MRKRFKELCIEVTKNREELKEQRELIDFLLEHDRNDVVLNLKAEWYSVYAVIKYIYDNKIKVVSTKLPYEYSGYEVIENTKEKIVLKILLYTFAQSYKFYKITKKDGIIMDITDIVNKTKEDERKKVESELEEKSKQEEPTTVANTDTPTTNCENCAKKSSCKLQNKVNFSELMPKMIVCDEFTPTKTDFKYFTAEQVRNMSQKEVKENYQDIMKSMKKWG